MSYEVYFATRSIETRLHDLYRAIQLMTVRMEQCQDIAEYQQLAHNREQLQSTIHEHFLLV